MKKKICLSLLLILLTPAIPVRAASIGSIEGKISENEAKIQDITKDKNAVSEKIKELNLEMQGVVQRLTDLSRELAQKQSSVQSLQKKIKEKEGEITETQKRIVETEKSISAQNLRIQEQEADLATQQAMLDERVRAAYMQNTTKSIILILFESRSILDFLDRLKFVERMTNQDKEIMDSINQLIAELEGQREDLEASKVTLMNEKESLIQQQNLLKESKAELEAEEKLLKEKLQSVKALEKEKKNTIARMSAEEKRIAQEIGDIMSENEALEETLQALIREAQRKAEEERKRREEEERQKNEPVQEEQKPSTQGFIRPIPGRLTSPFGNRMHPIWNVIKLHSGIDLAGNTGTPVKSTKAGKVIAAQYFSGYGNTVIVDHGGGVSSLYAHMNSIAVRVGERVTTGEDLGTVGSTGASTGPHLHFEIRVNGVPVNPLNYVSP